MPTCKKCASYFPNYQRIEGKIHNLQSRKFCLDCSPFKKHNTRPQVRIDPEGMRWCPRCRQALDVSAFYRRRGTDAVTTYCKPCTKQLVLERQQAVKRLAVAYKGGCCALCGYDRYIGSLEFHHLDPEAKEFTFAHVSVTDFDKIRAELDKCTLLCSNCHREEHARLRGVL